MVFRRFGLPLAFVGLLICTLWVYWQGRTGPFLFDDFPNLSPLGLNGGLVGVPNPWLNVQQFVFGGLAGPTGRPVALATFLLDAQDWPADPEPFKTTNLLLHLFTGVLAFAVFRKIGQAIQHRHADGLALVATALFLWLPVQCSTVFLVVQRMTILFTLFSLCALWGWLVGRERYLAGNVRAGYVWMTVSIVFFGSSAILSKETALVLPLLVLTLTLTVAPLPRSTRLWQILFLGLPTAVIAAYLLKQGLTADYSSRDFTLSERLLTQPLILWDYLYKIIVPKVTTVLFYDDFQKISQPSDLRFILPVLGWLILLVIVAYFRKKQPVFALAVLFFLAGHCLEAGPTPLELYFLHRNYQPMLGVVFALAYGIFALAKMSTASAKLLGGGYLLAAAVTTFASSQTWGNESRLVNIWAHEHPHSLRSVTLAANYWGVRRDYAKAYGLLDALYQARQTDPTVQIGRYYLRCLDKQEKYALWQEFLQRIPDYSLNLSMPDALDMLMINTQSGTCSAIKPIDVVAAMDDLISKNRFYGAPSVASVLRIRQAGMLLRFQRYEQAILCLEKSIASHPYIGAFDGLISIYQEQKNYAKAIETLERAIAFDPRTPSERKFVSDEPRKARLRAEIKRIEALMQQAAPSPPSSPPHTPAP
jgi:tetratricopeptide (TPR) repeat protein